jgi:peptidoglycan/LPS O-acetylase OafA/YrhL
VQAGRRTLRDALGSFYARRALRILPAYAIALLVCCALGYTPVSRQLAWFATYTVNVAQAFHWADFGYADHFWSLAVEEQFYLVWPLLVLVIARARLRSVLVIIVGVAAAGTLGAALAGLPLLACFRLPFLGSLIPLALGALLAEWRSARRDDAAERRFLVVAIGVGLPLLIWTQLFWFHGVARASPWYYGLVDIPFSLFATAALVVLSNQSVGPPWLRAGFAWSPLVAIGRISYGIYVGHRLLGAAWPSRFDPQRPWVGFAVASAVSIALAAASWFSIEAPILSLKSHFPSNNRPQVVELL